MSDNIRITGYVGKDAEMRFTPDGNAVTNFSVASNRSYKNKTDEWVNQTIWFKIVCWGKLAERMNQKIKKGMFAIVDGHLNFDPQTGSPKIWQKSDGSSAASFEVTANSVQFHWVDKEKGKEESETPQEETDERV